MKFYLYSTAFFVGAVILVIEIAGTRILAPFFGSTIFVWSAMIVVTLGALALGYYSGGYIADKNPQRRWLYVVIFLGGATQLILLKLSQLTLVWSDQFGSTWGPLFVCFVLFAVPLFLLSMSEPFIIRLQAEHIETAGKGAGLIFGLSTMGSLFGALIAGFYLIPNFLIGNIFTVLAVLTMLFAVLGLLLTKTSVKLLGMAIVLFLLSIALPVYHYKENSSSIIVHREPSFYADLKVIDLPRVRILLMDGGVQTALSRYESQSLLPYTDLFAHILFEKPKKDSVLVLGFGGVGVSKLIDKNISVDYVEIDPKVVLLAKEYFNYIEDQNDSIKVADARRYLRNVDKTYDAILIDLSNGISVVPHMYTREALSLVKERLNLDGIVYNNIVGKPDSTLIQSVIRTYQDVFPNVVVGVGKKDQLSVAIVASLSYIPDGTLSNGYEEISGAGTTGHIFTDAKSDMEVLMAESFGEVRKATTEVLGYTPLFTQ